MDISSRWTGSRLWVVESAIQWTCQRGAQNLALYDRSYMREGGRTHTFERTVEEVEQSTSIVESINVRWRQDHSQYEQWVPCDTFRTCALRDAP